MERGKGNEEDKQKVESLLNESMNECAVWFCRQALIFSIIEHSDIKEPFLLV
jgi:hypothetical protein